MEPSDLRKVMEDMANVFAIPLYVSNEEAVMGQVVFEHFVHQELEQQGFDEAMLVVNDIQAQGDQGLIDENLIADHEAVLASQRVRVIQIGSSIRQLADEFSRSPQREQIRAHADEVDLGAMTQDIFWCMMDQVFENGITPSNLIALFFFCTDVLVRCIRQKLKDTGFGLFKWALQYIAQKVCKWVHDRGGWEKACKDFMGNKYIFYGAICVAVAGVSWLVYRVVKS